MAHRDLIQPFFKSHTRINQGLWSSKFQVSCQNIIKFDVKKNVYEYEKRKRAINEKPTKILG